MFKGKPINSWIIILSNRNNPIRHEYWSKSRFIVIHQTQI